MAPSFDITPEKEGSLTHYFYRQLTYNPPELPNVSLKGKTAIVTGANAGIGFECSRQLLDLGISKLILAVRSEDRGKAAAEKLSHGRNLEPETIEVWLMDLSSYDSTTSFAERTKTLERIDIVILSAGIMPTKPKLNPNTGHDEVVQVNYLSTALLAILLFPVIKDKESNPTRITFVSSDAAAWTSFKEKTNKPLLPALDKTCAKTNMQDRYFVSKLLGQFFLTELAERVPSSIAIINAATPGMCHDSDLGREFNGTLAGTLVKPFQRRVGYKTSVGARLITDAAVNHGEETHGQYLGLGQTRIRPVAPLIYTDQGKEISQRLWDETMTELSFAGVEEILKRIGS